ncbi:MAG: 3-hydroxyacyl-CoA dehydrogenase NAD-binding domain-containing protein, partial [Alphaproteobacteria bacterium]
MIKRIGVIGAGQMGTGIAHVCALSGLDVRLMDISEDRLDAAMQAMDQNMERQVRRGL